MRLGFIKLELFFVVCLIVVQSACYYDVEEELYGTEMPCDTSFVVSYAQHVVPVITQNCNVCHASSVLLGGIATEGYANLSGLANSGRLIGVISHNSGFSPMPQGGNKLRDCDITTIQRWVDAGFPNN